MKRIIALVLTVTLLLGVCVTMAFADADSQYKVNINVAAPDTSGVCAVDVQIGPSGTSAELKGVQNITLAINAETLSACLKNKNPISGLTTSYSSKNMSSYQWENPDTLEEWSVNSGAELSEDGKTIFLYIQPGNQETITITQMTTFATIYVKLNSGKTVDDLTTDSVRFASDAEAKTEDLCETYAIKLNNSTGEKTWSNGGTGDTLNISPTITPVGFTFATPAWPSDAAVTITGTTKIGQTLTASISGATATSPTYKWQSSSDGTTWTDISGATAATYTTTQTGYVRVIANAENYRGDLTSNSVQVTDKTLTVLTPKEKSGATFSYGDDAAAVKANLDVTGTYDDGSTATISDFEITSGVPLVYGNNAITVKADGVEGTVYVTAGPKEITVTANNVEKTYGEADPTLTYTPEGLVNGDTLSGAPSREEGEDVGEYEIKQGTLSAGSNYTIKFVTGTLTIKPKEITVTADNKEKTYGDEDPNLTYTADGLVGTDKLSGALGRAEGEDVGEYPINIGTLNSANANYTVTLSNSADLTINKKTVENKTANGSARYGFGGSVSLSSYLEDGCEAKVTRTTDESDVLDGSVTIENGALKYKFKDDESLVDKSASVVLTVTGNNYAEYTITVTLTVNNAIPLTVSADPVSLIYGGSGGKIVPAVEENVTPTYTYAIKDNKDTNVVKVDSETGALTILNAGETMVTVTAIADNGAYFGATDVKVTVEPKPVNIPDAPTPQAYTGVELSCGIENTTDYMVEGGTRATDVGDYTVTVALKDKDNTKWSDGTTADLTLNWSITKAEITIEIEKPASVTVGGELPTFYYTVMVNGSRYMTAASGTTVELPDGSKITVELECDTSNTDTAGEYTVSAASVVFTGNTDNYDAPEENGTDSTPATLDITARTSGSILPKPTKPVEDDTDTTEPADTQPADTQPADTQPEQGPTGSMDNFTANAAYNGFSDVNESLWYGTQQQGVIKSAVELGIMNGYLDGTFAPGNNIKLSEVLKMAAMVNSIYCGNDYAFDQSQGAHWYDTYVNYLVEQGVIQAGEFEDLTADATRAQVAHIFANALPTFEAINHVTFAYIPDLTADMPYADEILGLYNAGVLTGDKGTNAFRSDDFITRAESAAIITRVAIPAERQILDD